VTSVARISSISFSPQNWGADIESLEGLFAREILLGQRRSLIGWFAFAAHDGDAAGKPTLAQGDGALRASMAPADDHDVLSVHGGVVWRKNAQVNRQLT
jgi:hypothetical protein